MQLRHYQQQAKAAILNHWENGVAKTLAVLPTGTGKTVIFSHIAETGVRRGIRVLILAHREELLSQAADKLYRATGLRVAVEKAGETCLDSWFRVVVGSVHTLKNKKRLSKFPKDYFGIIIVDEAHHAVSPSYRTILDHFDSAKVLGVTATADRGDKRNLGEYFETVAYEYGLSRAIKDGYLAPIMALTLPLEIDMSGVEVSKGDFELSSLGNMLDPYLERIAGMMATHCKDRKSVVFLPLIATSQKFCQMLNDKGLSACEVNGESKDRAEKLADFRDGKYKVLCNSMLLTEGWDEPSVDCIVCLRPTKVRSLYAQIVGRGTRPYPGKDHLLLLDFLWHTEKHTLCRPANLICKNTDIAARVSQIMAEISVDKAANLFEIEAQAESMAAAEREESLRKVLEEQRKRKRALVDPLQYEMSITGQLKEYEPDPFDLRQQAPASAKQLKMLEARGIFPDEIKCAGHASRIIETLIKRQDAGLATPKQIRCLEQKGFMEVGQWQFTEAQNMIKRLAASDWRIPHDVTPSQYKPESMK